MSELPLQFRDSEISIVKKLVYDPEDPNTRIGYVHSRALAGTHEQILERYAREMYAKYTDPKIDFIGTSAGRDDQSAREKDAEQAVQNFREFLSPSVPYESARLLLEMIERSGYRIRWTANGFRQGLADVLNEPTRILPVQRDDNKSQLETASTLLFLTSKFSRCLLSSAQLTPASTDNLVQLGAVQEYLLDGNSLFSDTPSIAPAETTISAKASDNTKETVTPSSKHILFRSPRDPQKIQNYFAFLSLKQHYGQHDRSTWRQS